MENWLFDEVSKIFVAKSDQKEKWDERNICLLVCFWAFNQGTKAFGFFCLKRIVELKVQQVALIVFPSNFREFVLLHSNLSLTLSIIENINIVVNTVNTTQRHSTKVIKL